MRSITDKLFVSPNFVYRLGLSMTLGAFIAGILLSESSFRTKIKVDIEPFRGLLLGLFFITTGMSMDISLLITKPLQVSNQLHQRLRSIAGDEHVVLTRCALAQFSKLFRPLLKYRRRTTALRSHHFTDRREIINSDRGVVAVRPYTG